MGYSKAGDSTADLRCPLVTFLAFSWRKLVVCCEYIAKVSSDIKRILGWMQRWAEVIMNEAKDNPRSFWLSV